MKKDLLIEAAIYVSCLSLVSLLWHEPVVLLLCLAVVGALMLRCWHRASDFLSYGTGFVLGPLGEAMAVHFGAWQYAKSLFLVPIWLPFLWGIAAFFIKRLCDTLLKTT